MMMQETDESDSDQGDDYGNNYSDYFHEAHYHVSS